MTTGSNNEIIDKGAQWIEDGIAGEYINYYDYDEFQNVKCIGTGGFGNVYRANWESSQSNIVVVLKSLKNENRLMKEIANEIMLMNKVNFHTNIIHFFGITKRKNSTDNGDSDYLFILEYADSGTLRNYLKNNFNKLDWNMKLQFAIQIADAVSCIHLKNIVHRDLHSSNILVHQNMIKLADFGLSRKTEVSNSTKSVHGMLPYIDPHLFKKENSYKNRPNKKSDVYSVGVLLWEISSGRKPFESYDSPHDVIALTLEIIKGKRETPIPGTPNDYVNIFTKCWRANPDDRPNMREVFAELKLINSNSNEALENPPVEITSNSSSINSYNSFLSSSSISNGESLDINDWQKQFDRERSQGEPRRRSVGTRPKSTTSKSELLKSFLKDHKKSLMEKNNESI